MNTYLAKLTRPAVGDGALQRQRLLDMLQPHADTASLVFVHAPAGAGKTTLAAAHAARSNLPYLWYRVDGGDDDPASLFYHLRLAALDAGCSGAKRLPLLKPEFVQGLEAFARNGFRRLFSGMSRNRFTLVFDDCHAVPTESTFFELLRIMAEELPPGGQLLLLSRIAPPPALARLRLDGGMLELDASLLALTEAESLTLARLRGRTDLSPIEVEALRQRVRSWMTGFLLELCHQTTVNDSPALPCGPSALLHDYFWAEACRKIGSAEQMLLMRLAVLPWMTPDSAAAVGGSRRAIGLIETMARDGVFTTRQGGLQPVFQFHSLFREFLLQRLAELMPLVQQDELRKLAATALEREGVLIDALGLAVQAQDWSHSRALVVRAAPTLVAEGRFGNLRSWLDRMPATEVEADAALSYWAGMATQYSDPDAALHAFRRAYRLATAQQDRPLIVLSWMGVIQAIFQTFRDLGQLDEAFDEFDRTVEPHLDCLSMNDRGRVVATGFLALAFRKPNHPRILTWTRSVSVMSRLIPDRLVRDFLRMQLAISHLWRGELNAALDVVKRFGAPRQALDGDPFIALTADLTRSSCWLHSGDLDACIEAVQHGLAVAQHSGVHVWDMTLCGNGAAAQLGSGNLDEARQLMQLMRERLDESRLVEYSQFLGLQAWEQLEAGHCMAALQHIDSSVDAIARAGVPYFHGVGLLMAVEIQVSCMRFDEARASIQQLDATIEATGNAMLIWLRHLMTARLAQAQGDATAAIAELSEGLRWGRQHGYQHFYFWPQQALGKLFAMALENGVESEYVRHLIAHNRMPPPTDALERSLWPWPLKIFTLGQFRVEIDGQPLGFVGKVQKAPLYLLKALIALGGEGVAEHLLADALWPDSEGDAGILALATTLNRLRKLVGHDAIIRHGGVLALNPSLVWCDALALQSMLTARSDNPGQAMRAIDLLYKNRFLGNEGDVAWAAPLRDRLHKLVVSAIQVIGHNRAMLGQHDEVIAVCERGIAIDNLVEPFYEVAINACAALGHHAAAVRLYRLCQVALDTQLGVAPSPRTTMAYIAAQPAAVSRRDFKVTFASSARPDGSME